MKRILCLLSAAALLLAACSNPARQEAATRSFTDGYGRTVQVPAAPSRIVSLSPAVTEIIYALGADSLLAGRTDYCLYPAQAAGIPSVGGISNLNAEQVLACSPDLVIGGSLVSQPSTRQLEAMGLPVALLIEEPQFEAIYSIIENVGTLTGHSHQADSLIRLIRHEADSIVQSRPAQTHSVYYVVGFGPSGNFTAGGNTFINDIITLAGGRNIAADITGWSFSLEALMQADPEYIVIRQEDAAAFCAAQPYSRLTAVRQGRVIPIESGIIDNQGPRNIEAVKILAAALNRQ